jgi:hypothetical protein
MGAIKLKRNFKIAKLAISKKPAIFTLAAANLQVSFNFLLP